MSLTWSPDYAPVDADFADVSLLLKGEGTNGSTTILDSSSNNLSVTANGDAQISTAVATPFSPTVPSDGVLALDGNGDKLTVPSSALLGFGTGDFTIELWVYLNLITGGGAFIDFRTAINTSYPLFWQASGVLYYYTQGASRLTISGLQPNTFYHVAVSRSNNQSRLFLNGVQSNNTYNDNGDYGTSGTPTIASNYANQGFLNGYISNLRITKGVARYTGNFDVPTAPFPILSPSTRIEVGDGFDVEAANYILAVEAADAAAGQSGGLEAGVRTAINDFVVGCKSDGIWNAIKASCLLSGARTLEGALVPLKGSAPTNNGPFVAADYDRELGLVGDGSTKYLDTNKACSSELQNNVHGAVYANTRDFSAGRYLGSASSSISFELLGNSTGFRARVNATTLNTLGTSTSSNVLIGVSRNSATAYSWRDGTQSGTQNNNSSGVPSGNYFVFSGLNGYFPTGARIAFYSIGSNLDLALLDTRISNFITAIGAAIP